MDVGSCSARREGSVAQEVKRIRHGGSLPAPPTDRGRRAALLGNLGLVLAMALALVASSCSSAGLSTSRAAVVGNAPVWLCRPGAATDPCASNRSTTEVQAGGAQTALPSSDRVTPMATEFDCFYVYPTVSDQKAANSNLTVQQVEIDVAVDQASQFSQVCRVWAPMYRQATASSIATGLSSEKGAAAILKTTFDVAYESLVSSWTSFLAHDAGNKPLILIGHSQGSALLIHLVATQVDHDPALLKRLVVAIVPGGNLQVPSGRTIGATFAHVPLCTRPSEISCAIAYSTFPSEPPLTSLFGRSGQGVSLQSGQTSRHGEQVACVNPAALGGGTADLDPYFLTATQDHLARRVSTPWVTYPDLYSASCEDTGGASWLQVTDVAQQGDGRPVVTETLGPDWGYHANDINLTLGNLVHDVHDEEAAWLEQHRGPLSGPATS